MFVSDDAGTPFIVVIIPIHDRLAVQAQETLTQYIESHPS